MESLGKGDHASAYALTAPEADETDPVMDCELSISSVLRPIISERLVVGGDGDRGGGGARVCVQEKLGKLVGVPRPTC